MRRRRSCLVAVIALALAAAPIFWAQHAAADWGAPTFISTSRQYSTLTQMYGDLAEGPDGALHAVWTEFDRTAGSPWSVQHSLRYARSADGGATWSPAVTVATTTSLYAGYMLGKLALSDSGRIHLAFYYMNNYGSSAIQYAKSDDQGQTWAVTYLQGGCFPWYPTPALDGDGNVYFAWERWKCNYSTLPNRVFFSRSLDQGDTWAQPSEIAEGGVGIGWVLAADADNRLHLVYRGAIDGTYQPWLSRPYYATSADRGDSWEVSPLGPENFSAGGILSAGGALLVPGRLDEADVFLRSTDGGATWSAPRAISGLPSSYSTVSQIVVDAQGTYHTWKDQSYVTSRDGGQTWSVPEYLGNGAIGKLLVTSSGSILAIGSFSYSATDSCVGVVKYHEPFGVDAPAFLSTWEKASLRYHFSVRGTGVVQASFPAAAVEISPGATVLADGQSVAATVAAEGERVIVSFPVASEDWTDCSVPVFMKKGSVEKRAALAAEVARLDEAFVGAAAAGEGESALQIDGNRAALRAELASSAQEFVVSILDGVDVRAEDRTQVAIYEKLTAVYAHLKAGASQDGAELLLKTADTITVAKEEPFLLEAKVTHLKEGETAGVSLSGSFSTIDRIETNATGTHQTSFYLFYPPDSPVQSEEIVLHVEVGGVVTAVPVTVVVR